MLLNIENLQVTVNSGEFWNKQTIKILAGVSLHLNQGESYAVVGESGSGKTTLIRAIGGLIPISGGHVTFKGQQISGISTAAFRPLRKEIAMMFQDPKGSLSPRLSVGGLLAEPFRIHGLKNRDLNAEARRLLNVVGLPSDFIYKYPHQLSGGQARRVGVARALSLNPTIVLADEPTAGLDVSVQGELLNLLNKLRDTLGLAMLIITHNLNVVRHTADRIGVMYLGRLVEEGNTNEVFTHPRHPYTLCLLSANPEPNPDSRRRRIALKGDPPSIAKRPSGCEFRSRCPFAEALCEHTPDWSADSATHSVRCVKPL